MAKKTNKTDHVLNLLSTGSKKGDTGKNERDAAPVQLRRPGGSDTQSEEQNQQDLPDLPDLPEEKQAESRPPAPDLPDIPEVSVVHTEGEENPIADAVKESLEAELESYLEEEEGAKEQLQSSEAADDPGLPDLPDLPDAPQDSDLPDLPDLPDASELPAAPDMPDLPDLPDLPDVPQTPDLPDLPDTPAPQEAPDTPDLPDLPAEEAASESDKPALDTEPLAADSPQPQDTPAAEGSPEPSSEQDPETQQEPVPAAEPAADKDRKPEEPAAQDTEPAADPSEPASAPAPAAAAEAGPEDGREKPDYTTLNVMEQLVKAQVPQYVKQFGHCSCDRCMADVVALTLTHLPAKYVVVNKSAISPLMNFYEKRYAGQIVVEITKAAMVVREFPHHSRKD